MKYILNFLFLAINVALGPLIVIIYARKDLDLASEFSYLLAIVSLIFSIGLLNQRNYLYLYQNNTYSYSSQFTFRMINCTILFALFLSLYSIGGNDIRLLILIFLLKISESIIDFKHTLVSQSKEIKELANLIIVEVIPRVIFLLLSISLISDFGLLYKLAILVIAITYFSLRYKNSIIFEINDYSNILFSLRNLGFVGLLTSVFSILPRLLLEPEKHNSELVALSLSPLLGLIFQSVWISMAGELRHYNRKIFLNYIIKIVVIQVVILVSYPFWDLLSATVYGINEKKDIKDFTNTIIASSTLFACAALCNLLKIIKVKLDILAYIVAISSMLLMSLTSFPFIQTVVVSAFFMLLIFIYGFICNEKNNFHKK